MTSTDEQFKIDTIRALTDLSFRDEFYEKYKQILEKEAGEAQKIKMELEQMIRRWESQELPEGKIISVLLTTIGMRIGCLPKDLRESLKKEFEYMIDDFSERIGKWLKEKGE